MLPLLLVFLVLCSSLQRKRGKHGFWIIGLLFVLTGIAIVVYLNQTPYQPRERDYAYAGSFYAFTIWIGLGVLFLIKLIDKYIPKFSPAALVSIVLLVFLHLWFRKLDDHDRSTVM
jgi:cobalamin synthase